MRSSTRAAAMLVFAGAVGGCDLAVRPPAASVGPFVVAMPSPSVGPLVPATPGPTARKGPTFTPTTEPTPMRGVEAGAAGTLQPVPRETPVISGSPNDVRGLIWLEFLKRAPAATCWGERNGEYDLERLRQKAQEVARDATIHVGLVEADWFIGPRVLAGRALAGGELLALPTEDVAWYAAPGVAVERRSEMAAVMLFGFTVADGQTLWWRTADFIEVFPPPCERPEHH